MNKKQIQKLEQMLDHVGDIALRRRAKKMLLYLNPENGERILDVGCGDAFYLHILSNLGLKLRLYGSDIDPTALKSAKLNLKNKQVSSRPARSKKIIFKQADLMKKLPFKDNFFDKVVMSEVAEHLPDDVKGMKEIFRVLKPGGVLCLTVPNANYPFMWDPVNKILETTTGNHVKDGFWAGLWFNHIRLYTVSQMKKVLEKAKFKVEKIESVTYWCLPFNHHIVNLAARIIYGKKVSASIVKAVSKYEIKQPLSPSVRFGFGVFRLIDSLNDIYQPKNFGVGVFAKAVK